MSEEIAQTLPPKSKIELETSRRISVSNKEPVKN